MLKVIAIGSALRGDDSIGPHVVNELSRMEIPVPLNLIDAGSDAFILLEHLIGEDPVLVVDCARMNKSPGEFAKFKLDQLKKSVLGQIISMHGFSLMEVVRMAESVGNVADCTIIGIEPKQTDFGEGLSEEVQNSVPSIIKMVIEEAKKHAKENFDR